MSERCPSSTATVPSRSWAATAPSYGRTSSVSHAWRLPSPRNAQAARSQKSSTSKARSRIVRVETHPGDDLAAEQPEVRDTPEVHGVDPGARPPADAADLLGGHRGVDGSDHLGVAVPALDARRDDVRGHRDQLRLERSALGAQRLRDRRVVRDQAVRLGSVIASGLIAINHGRSPPRPSSRPRPRRRSRVPRTRTCTPSRTGLGTRGSRSRCGCAACRRCR